MIEELLKEKNLKVTKQRTEILNIINGLGCSCTIKNIIEKCNDIDTSTIYRTIGTLESNNILEKIIGTDNEVIYTIISNHRHYVKCIKCNSIKEVDVCPIDLDEYISGYKIIRHSLIIDGICEKCQKSQR